jgi:hypothetical protein
MEPMIDRRTLVLALAPVVLAAACTKASDTPSPSPSGVSSSSQFAVEVATSDLYIDAPQRVQVGILSSTTDGGVQLVSYGEVQFAFTHLGANGSATAVPNPGPTATATYLATPGTQTEGTGPALTDPATARGVYQAEEVTFDEPGLWQVRVTADIAGSPTQELTSTFEVRAKPALPAPGDEALRTQTLTMATRGVPASAIDSRALDAAPVPDPELHRTTIAAALKAGKPILALFATPVYCTSRFCGPETDALQSMADAHADEATFIHVEIWKDYQASVVNKGAADWLYRDGDLREPWLFLVGTDGRIVDRWAPLFDPDEVLQELAAIPNTGD